MDMRNCWKVLLIAAVVLVGCGKGDKQVVEGTRPGGDQPGPDQLFTLKVKSFADPGNSVTVHTKFTMVDPRKITEDQGKEFEVKIELVSEKEFIETVLEKGDGAPKRYKRSFKKASVSRNGKEMELPYHGNTIAYENTGESYLVSLEGKGMLLPPDVIELTEEAKGRLKGDSRQDVLPGKPVKVGDTWALSRKFLEERAGKGNEIDADKSKGEARLARVYTKDGKQYGVIEVTADVVIKGMKQLQLAQPGKFQGTGTYDMVADGSSPAGTVVLKGKLNARGILNAGGKKATIEMNQDQDFKAEYSGESPAK